MKKLLLLAAVAFTTPVHASECDEETVRRVTHGGSTLVLESGGAYEVEPDDILDTSLWHAGDAVLVCGDEEVINKDNGDKVHVTPVR